jgi:hypothetical protein
MIQEFKPELQSGIAQVLNGMPQGYHAQGGAAGYAADVARSKGRSGSSSSLRR